MAPTLANIVYRYRVTILFRSRKSWNLAIRQYRQIVRRISHPTLPVYRVPHAGQRQLLAERESTGRAVLRSSHDDNGHGSGALFGAPAGSFDLRLGHGRRHPQRWLPSSVPYCFPVGQAASVLAPVACARNQAHRSHLRLTAPGSPVVVLRGLTSLVAVRTSLSISFVVARRRS
jgi:hypothetical protein